ncbi:MAG: helix-turn-helix transcriptional regulator [Verrucomicrobia bacterium]|nr:helix-turn-helix transcriptional regulator [Cytophagales bacterium]
MDTTQLSDTIRNRRKILGLRQEDLAEMAEIHVLTLKNIENGKGNPSFQTLAKITEILGLEIQITIKNEPTS